MTNEIKITRNGDDREVNVGKGIRSDYREYKDYSVAVNGVEVARVIRGSVNWELRPVVSDLETRATLTIEYGTLPLASAKMLKDAKVAAIGYFA